MFNKIPDRKKILDLYEYKDGALYYKANRTTWVKKGDRAGSEHKNTGYRSVIIQGKRYQEHRVIWKLLTGNEPDGEIDHINGDRSDNRIENLRCVSKGENLLNQKTYSNNKSGVPGVYWAKKKKKWCVQITKDGIQQYHGCFSDLADAVSLRKKLQEEFGFHKNHGSKGRRA